MTRFVLSEAYERGSRGVPIMQRPAATALRQPRRNPQPPEACNSAPALLTLRLGGSFAALDMSGTPIPLSQKKGRMMLAMLACAPEMSRSRDWLRCHLWHRAFTSHGYSSLRQCLHNLRHALGDAGVCLCADRDHIWLDRTSVNWGDCRTDPTRFLEDVLRLDGPAQDWLDRERSRLAAQADSSAA